MVTNLDEQGKRVGGEIPAVQSNSPDERFPEYVPEAPREMYVTVRHEDSGERSYEEQTTNLLTCTIRGTEAYRFIPAGIIRDIIQDTTRDITRLVLIITGGLRLVEITTSRCGRLGHAAP